MFPRMVNKAARPIALRFPTRRWGIAAAAAAALAIAAAGCGSSATSANTSSNTTVISAIGAENEYANVLGQIGGRYVQVSAILDDPSTDPHTFEASPRVAQEVISQPSSAAGHFQAGPTQPVLNHFSGKAVQPLNSLGFVTTE